MYTHKYIEYTEKHRMRKGFFASQGNKKNLSIKIINESDRERKFAIKRNGDCHLWCHRTPVPSQRIRVVRMNSNEDTASPTLISIAS